MVVERKMRYNHHVFLFMAQIIPPSLAEETTPSLLY